MKKFGFYLTVLLALILMGASAETITLKPGEYPITTNTTYDKTVVFEQGAYLTIAPDVTVTFNQGFTAGEWHIFRGKGKIAGVRKLIPEWFGAIGNGKADDTEALQRTLDSCRDQGFGAGAGNVIVLKGIHLVGSLNADTTYLNIHSENAWLIAKPAGNYPYLIRFSKHFCKVTGTLSIDGNYNLGYDCMINVNTRHFIGNDIVIWRANLAWLFGDRSWATSGKPGDAEKGDSEVQINGGSTVHCLRGVEAVGANTIIHFNNAHIYSYPWTLQAGDPRKEAWEAADSTLVRSIGSLIYFTGGGLANFTSKVPLIEVQPIRCTQREYFSNYGAVSVANTHIESGNLFATANPNKIPNQDYQGNPTVQDMISLTMTSCGGYLSGGNAILINTDPLFSGGIVVDNCNFYAYHRDAPLAKIGNPKAWIKIDEYSVNDKHSKGINSVIGGKRIYTEYKISEAGARPQAR